MKTGVISFASLVAFTALAFVSSSAPAQTYPIKPIRLIVPFPPGGVTDATARILAQTLSEGPGWQVVVENRTGATGRIGTELAAKAPPDGYTLLLGTAAPNAILPGAYSKLSYDAVKDFAPISQIISSDYVLVVHPSMPVKSIKDLIAIAKNRPGQVTFASAGNLSVAHLAGEFFKQFAKVDIVHVAYTGGGPAVISVMSGDTALYFGDTSGVVHQVKAGRLRAIATTGTKRRQIFPDAPTIAETLPGYEIAQWAGVLAPAGTPGDIVSRLHTTIVKAVGTAKVAQQFAVIGFDLVGSSPEEFAAKIKADVAKWGRVVKASGVSLE